MTISIKRIKNIDNNGYSVKHTLDEYQYSINYHYCMNELICLYKYIYNILSLLHEWINMFVQIYI